MDGQTRDLALVCTQNRGRFDGGKVTMGAASARTDRTLWAFGPQSVAPGVEVLGHRRNSHGPMHLGEKWPRWTGPGQYGNSAAQIDRYRHI
jgi:hypothetical protein